MDKCQIDISQTKLNYNFFFLLYEIKEHICLKLEIEYLLY